MPTDPKDVKAPIPAAPAPAADSPPVAGTPAVPGSAPLPPAAPALPARSDGRDATAADRANEAAFKQLQAATLDKQTADEQSRFIRALLAAYAVPNTGALAASSPATAATSMGKYLAEQMFGEQFKSAALREEWTRSGLAIQGEHAQDEFIKSRMSTEYEAATDKPKFLETARTQMATGPDLLDMFIKGPNAKFTLGLPADQVVLLERAVANANLKSPESDLRMHDRKIITQLDPGDIEKLADKNKSWLIDGQAATKEQADVAKKELDALTARKGKEILTPQIELYALGSMLSGTKSAQGISAFMSQLGITPSGKPFAETQAEQEAAQRRMVAMQNQLVLGQGRSIENVRGSMLQSTAIIRQGLGIVDPFMGTREMAQGAEGGTLETVHAIELLANGNRATSATLAGAVVMAQKSPIGAMLNYANLQMKEGNLSKEEYDKFYKMTELGDFTGLQTGITKLYGGNIGDMRERAARAMADGLISPTETTSALLASLTGEIEYQGKMANNSTMLGRISEFKSGLVGPASYTMTPAENRKALISGIVMQLPKGARADAQFMLENTENDDELRRSLALLAPDNQDAVWAAAQANVVKMAIAPLRTITPADFKFTAAYNALIGYDNTAAAEALELRDKGKNKDAMDTLNKAGNKRRGTLWGPAVKLEERELRAARDTIVAQYGRQNRTDEDYTFEAMHEALMPLDPTAAAAAHKLYAAGNIADATRQANAALDVNIGAEEKDKRVKANKYKLRKFEHNDAAVASGIGAQSQQVLYEKLTAQGLDILGKGATATPEEITTTMTLVAADAILTQAKDNYFGVDFSSPEGRKRLKQIIGVGALGAGMASLALTETLPSEMVNKYIDNLPAVKEAKTPAEKAKARVAAKETIRSGLYRAEALFKQPAAEETPEQQKERFGKIYDIASGGGADMTYTTAKKEPGVVTREGIGDPGKEGALQRLAMAQQLAIFAVGTTDVAPVGEDGKPTVPTAPAEPGATPSTAMTGMTSALDSAAAMFVKAASTVAEAIMFMADAIGGKGDGKGTKTSMVDGTAPREMCGVLRLLNQDGTTLGSIYVDPEPGHFGYNA